LHSYVRRRDKRGSIARRWVLVTFTRQRVRILLMDPSGVPTEAMEASHTA
jgi:hypothetical protein